MKKLFFAAFFIMAALPLQAQKLHVIESDNLHCNDSILVFSPKGQQAKMNIPTAFVLHGAGGCYSNWARRMDLQSLANNTGFRIICPDGFSSGWYIDNADKSKMQWMTFFETELYPLMNREYGLDPQKTFITGLSMGGHGAMTIFLSHSEWFRSGGSMSGVLDIRGRERLAGMLGAYSLDDHVLYDHSAIGMIDAIKGTDKFCIVTCGTEDSLIGSSRRFEQACLDAGVKVISMYSPGKHDWKYWPFILEYHLDWFKRIMNGEPLGF